MPAPFDSWYQLFQMQNMQTEFHRLSDQFDVLVRNLGDADLERRKKCLQRMKSVIDEMNLLILRVDVPLDSKPDSTVQPSDALTRAG
jgi:hypothetical protein